jgi:hypothetical protein
MMGEEWEIDDERKESKRKERKKEERYKQKKKRKERKRKEKKRREGKYGWDNEERRRVEEARGKGEFGEIEMKTRRGGKGKGKGKGKGGHAKGGLGMRGVRSVEIGWPKEGRGDRAKRVCELPDMWEGERTRDRRQRVGKKEEEGEWTEWLEGGASNPTPTAAQHTVQYSTGE